MKGPFVNVVLSFAFMLVSFVTDAQNRTIDSLRAKLPAQRNDTSTLNTFNKLINSFFEIDDCDSALHYSNFAVKLAVALKDKQGEAMAKYHTGISLRCKKDYANSYLVLNEAKKLFIELKNDLYTARCLHIIATIFSYQDNSTDALENFFSALHLSELIKDTTETMRNLISISQLFYESDKYEKSLEYARQYEAYAYSREDLHPRDIVTQRLGYIYEALENDSLSLHFQLESLHLSEMQHDTLGIANSYMDLGYIYKEAKDFEKSLEYLSNAQKMYWVINDTSGVANSFSRRAETYEAMDKFEWALREYFESLRFRELQKNRYGIAYNNLDIGKVFFTIKNYPKAQHYFQNYLALATELAEPEMNAEAYKHLSDVSEKLNKPSEALRYLNQFMELKDSIERKNSEENLIGVEAKKHFERVVQENKMQQAKDNFDAKIKIYSLMAGVVFLSLIAVMLVRNVKQKQKAKNKIEKAFHILETTQAQLIQSEKMASLGELTAGIAHEIQNPLNFVNNFSDVNKELLLEMKEEVEKGNFEEVKSIAGTLIDNQEKITHHGKRADAIVKGMLQHSRSSSGIKEATNINALVEEYLKLAYHGLRAKDKTFNVTLKTSFDDAVNTVNIIPQDIGRVILNLLNNAFYAVGAKKNQGTDGYEPTVSVSSKKSAGVVSISIADNGSGIPNEVLSKIFQPFFTTKPTGQGTGLGLSLSYDIVKAHGGELRVKTDVGKGSEFTIELPA